MFIKILKNSGDFYSTKINGTIKEIAEHYFSMPDTREIIFLSGGVFENEFYIRTPVKVYRASEKEIKENDLFYNIILESSIFRKKAPYPFGKTIETERTGLLRI